MGLTSIDLLQPADFPTLKKFGLTCAMVSNPTIKGPTGELGGITKAFNRKEHHDLLVQAYEPQIDAVADAEERAALHKRLTDALKRSNTAIEVAARYLYDDVIDPADTRDILIKTLATLPPPTARTSWATRSR